MSGKMWMVRGEGGKLYDSFMDQNIVAIGWAEIGPFIKKNQNRKELLKIYQGIYGERSSIQGSSQIWRFINELQISDWVITYSPTNRTYLLGQIISDFEYHPELQEKSMALLRNVIWEPQEINRDRLTTPTKNTLGSILTVFQIKNKAKDEILNYFTQTSNQAEHKITSSEKEIEINSEEIDPLAEIEYKAIEAIKDYISKVLKWDDTQNLVAGILRSMGYKTQVSSAGADRGKDIIASPDGFGFENPRILVEVKHRQNQTDSALIRSFVGGRHKDDRGLYVSTGGFTKDARYEADRSSIPLTLWTLDDLARALINNYENIDLETKLLVPLKKVYIPTKNDRI